MSTKKIVNLQHKSNNSGSDEIMTEAMQTILYDNEIELLNSSDSFMETISTTGKPMTSFELVAQTSKTSPLKAQQIVTSNSNTPSAKIKIIPSNQFVQLKPGGNTSGGSGILNTGHLQTPTQIYTIKNSTPNISNTIGTIGNIMSTPVNNQSQIIKFKTTPTMMGQSKFTLVKNSNRVPLSNASVAISTMTPITLTTATTTSSSSSSSTITTHTQKSNVDITSIINLPIVFADQQGNLSETMNVSNAKNNNEESTSAPAIAPASTPNIAATTSKPIKFNIINQKFFKPVGNNANITNNMTTDNLQISKASMVKIGGQTFVLNKPVIDPKKLILINPSAGNVLGRIGVTTTAATSTATTPVNLGQPIKYATTLRPGTQIMPISAASAVSGLKQVDLHDLQLNRASTSSNATSNNNLVQKIKIINSTPLNSSNMSGVRNFVLKPGQFRPFPAPIRTQLFNRTVNMGNFIPVTKINSVVKLATTIPTQINTTTKDTATNIIVASTPRQSAPKIITIDPLETTSLIDDVEEYTTMSIDD